MPRQSTPERLDAARQEATRQRLMDEGVSPDWAAEWIVRWENEAGRRGLARDGAYWGAG